jgi:hypothetical protein
VPDDSHHDSLVNTNATPTFAIFVKGNAIIPFDPIGSSFGSGMTAG